VSASGRGAPWRLGFWNTWLLRPRLWPGGPALPGADRFFAPDVERRAPLVGAAVRGRFDAVALAEVFEAEEQRAVADAWPGVASVAGPLRRGLRRTNSGLLTLADPASAVVEGSERLAYRSGRDPRDSDTFAAKGALLVHLGRTDGGPGIDLVSTHLMAGGDLLPIPGHDDRERHHRTRMAQVDELVAFVDRHRDRARPLLLAGDLNVIAEHPGHPESAATYRDLLAHLAPLGGRDLWADLGVGDGPTCTFTAAADLPPDPADPDAVDDHVPAPPPPAERIDYLWLVPAATGPLVATPARPRRLAFPGRAARGGPAGSLSDHLALAVDVEVTAG